MRLTPKGWREFQHYGKRRPPWIKLHRRLLDDIDFLRLQAASRALAPMLWLLASEDMEGSFDADPDTLALRLRLSKKEIVPALKELVAAGFFLHDASTMLATREQGASPVSVLCTSVSVPLERESVRGRVQPEDPAFDAFWQAYEKQTGKQQAIKAWKREASSPETVAKIMAKVPLYVASTPEKRYRKHPATWLNQRCWEDEIIEPASRNGHHRPDINSIVPKVFPPGYHKSDKVIEEI